MICCQCTRILTCIILLQISLSSESPVIICRKCHLRKANLLSNSTFLLDEVEAVKLREDVKVLVGRVLVAHIQQLSVHNFILTKFQHKFQFFNSKYVFQTQNEVPILINFMNKLLFPVLTEWIVQFTVHAFDTASGSYRLFFFLPHGLVFMSNTLRSRAKLQLC